MSSGLDPSILQKLEAFSQRRRRLIVLRGVFAAVGMLLATMMAVALLDYVFVLPDSIRYVLSGIAYTTVLIVEWLACLRLLVASPGPAQLARIIEHAEPRLREDLLSAVELGQSSATYDSEEFRRLAQADVANRVEGLSIEKLLPVWLLRRTIALTALVLIACVTVFVVSGFQFGTLLIRAMFPMANLGRVSKVQVRIIEPAPAERMVPQGDRIPVVIEVSGPQPGKAVLETFTTQGREVVPMTADGSARFLADIQVGREDITYRIRAGDALTRKYQLRAMARPHVTQFRKVFKYPEYVKLPAKEVVEANGDLAGLEETVVSLEMESDQPIKSAELRMEQGKERLAIPLNVAGTKITADVPLKDNGFYRIHLIGAESGFENKFSPEYSIRSEPDLIPQIEIEDPKADLILPANEIVNIRGNASDDYGLAKISQKVRVNTGEWKEVLIPHSESKAARIELRWDLYQERVKAGDLVTTKLVAMDMKGSLVESRPVQITITSAGYELSRISAITPLRELVRALKEVKMSAENLEKKARESREQIERFSENDPQRRPAIALFLSALEEFEAATRSATDRLDEALRSSTPGHVTGELVGLGRLLARTWHGAERGVRDFVGIASVNETLPFVRDLVREASEGCGRIAHFGRIAEESGRVFLTSEGLEVLNEKVIVITREQDRIAELAGASLDDPSRREQAMARSRVVIDQLKAVEELLEQIAENATDGFHDRLRNHWKDLERERMSLESAVDKQTSGGELSEPLKRFTRATADFRQRIFDAKRDFMHPPARAFRAILNEAQSTWTNIETARHEVEHISRNDRVPPPRRLELMNARWNAKVSAMKMHGDLEEIRPDSDTAFVSDVRATTLALTSMREPLLGGEKPFASAEANAKFSALDKAFRVLEGAHDLAEVYDGLTRLSIAEQWDAAALRSRTAHPRDWQWLEARMRSIPDEFGRIQPEGESARQAIEAARKILWEAQGEHAWRTLNEEMNQRMRPEATSRPVSNEAAALASRVKKALDLLREPVKEARHAIAQMAPTLPELLTQLAQKAETLGAETSEQAQQASAKSPLEIQANAKQQLAEQRQLNRDLDALRDALRSDANQQNIFEQEGRERARDADDALAMLKDPPPAAEEALARAAAKTEGADQQPLLEKAASEQEKLADALNQLARHYEALEKGNAKETRLALRESESALGVKDAMERRYSHAEALTQMANANPEEMLKGLEKELPRNPLMRQELSEIAKNTLQSATDKLSEASQREKTVAEQVKKIAEEESRTAQATQQAASDAPHPQNQAVSPEATPSNQPDQNAPQEPSQPQPAPDPASSPRDPQPAATEQSQPAPQQSAPNPQLAQAAEQQSPIAQATTEAGMQVSRAGRHEERLQNPAGENLERLGEEIRETGIKDVAEARTALENAPAATQAQAKVEAVNAELQRELGQLAAATQSGSQMSNTPKGEESRRNGKATEANPPAEPPGAQSSQLPAAAQTSRSDTQSGRENPDTPQNARASSSENGAAPAEEQLWMARALDALDGALYGEGALSQGQAANSQPLSEQQRSESAGQNQQSKNAETLAKAKQAMASAAQAASASVRTSRVQEAHANQTANTLTAQGEEQSVSDAGALADGRAGSNSSALPGVPGGDRRNDWGKLPKKVAEQLAQGQREAVAPEYRSQVETYYRVIAERAKKQ